MNHTKKPEVTGEAEMEIAMQEILKCQALVTYAVYVKNLATGYVTALNLKSAKSSAMDVCAMLF